MSRRLLPWLLNLLLILVPYTTGAAETKVYDLKHLQGHALEETVRNVLGEQAKVTSLRNQLIVVAETDQQRQVEDLVRRLDQPARMLRVSIDQTNSGSLGRTSVSAAGRIDTGNIMITTGQPDRERGNVDVRVRSGDDRLRVGARSETETVQQSVSQFIVVMDGDWGQISVGRRVPFTERLRVLCRRHHPVIIETIEYQVVDTGFEVLPQVYGDQVELDIRPYLSMQDHRHPERIVFQDLATRVRVPLGNWFDLGGHMSRQDDVSREILSLTKETRQNDGTIRVKVDPQP